MRVIILILAAFILFSCNTTKQAQKRLKRLKNNHSELFDADTTYVIKTDTILVEVPEYVFDTIVEISDSVIIETERFKTVIQVVKDSIPYYIVKQEIKSVEVPVEVVDTLTIIKEKVLTETEYKKYVPIWIYILLSFLLLYTIRRFFS